MAITVTHKFVSAIPDGDDASVVRPSNWNDTHELTGLGTMAEQNANAVAITGGTISGVSVSGYVPTTTTITAGTGLTGGGDLSANRTLALANTAVTTGTYGTAARTITQTVDQQGRLTNIFDQPIEIANTQVTGLGTASTKDAGVANGVATLDGSGTVPISQLPAAVLGALSYQGTWNASTNTPTLTSSVGTKGYYYVVNVAGSTDLNGITDWKVGDWAVYNGTAWQKIDNTDAVTSVNGYTGTVVLGYADVGAFPATATTGTGSVVLQTSPTINTPTLSGATVDGSAPYMNYTPTTAPTYVEGRVFYDSTAKTLNYYNDNSEMSVNIGQEQIIRVRNQTGSDIPDGSVVYVNGATGNTPTISLAIATSFSTADIIGVTTTNVANNGFGYVTVNGLVNGLDTSAFTDGNPVFLSATTAGAFTATEPVAPNYAVQVGVIIRANPSVGTLLVATQQISTEVSHIIGTLAVNQGGTGQTSYTNGQLLIGNTTGNTLTKSTLTAGTGVSVTNGAGSITIANTAPDQTVAISSGTGISVTGTYPNFTVTNTSPSSGGTVTSVSALTLGTTGTDLSSTVANSTTTPVITLNVPTASATNRGALSSTDWSTFNGKQAALVSGTNIKTVNGSSLLGSGDVGTIDVAHGGTGATSATAYAVLCGGTTSTGAHQSIASVGTSGQVLTSNGAGALPTFQTVGGSFPSGTALLFQQTAAPTGWTKQTTHDNKALRVVSGTASSGGTVAFTTAFASQAVNGTNANTTATNQSYTPAGSVGTSGATTLSTSQIPLHAHDIQRGGTQGQAGGNPYLWDLFPNSGTNYSATQGTGGGGSHTHSGGSFTGTAATITQNAHTHTFTGTAIDLAVQYVDVIIATKD